MSQSIAQEHDWATWMTKLQEPFDPEEVDYRVAHHNLVVAYVDARTVAKHLDEAVGAQNWSFDWSVISLNAKGEVAFAKGILTIGGVTKCDIGDASNQDASKGAVSDALKRAAVLFGVGRYLYDLPIESVEVASGKPTAAALKKLRSALPKPSGYTAPVITKVIEEAQTRLLEMTPEQIEDTTARAQATYPGNRMSALPEPTPIRKHKTEAAPAEQLIPIEPTEKDWQALKARIFKAKVATTVAAFERLMEQTGGSYEDVLAKVEAVEQEQHDLRNVPVLDGRKGNH